MEIRPEKLSTTYDQGAGCRPGTGKEARRMKEGEWGRYGPRY